MAALFKKWTPDEAISVVNQLKSSQARGVRAQLAEQYPTLSALFDTLLPKKTPLRIARGAGGSHLQYVLDEAGRVLFFAERDGPWTPTLRLVHEYPALLPTVRVDRGAIRFVLAGADVMCPGLTSAGGELPADADALPADTLVAVTAEGKEHALAVGRLLLSTAEIRAQNAGHGVANLHYLGDGLYDNGKDIK